MSRASRGGNNDAPAPSKDVRKQQPRDKGADKGVRDREPNAGQTGNPAQGVQNGESDDLSRQQSTPAGQHLKASTTLSSSGQQPSMAGPSMPPCADSALDQGPSARPMTLSPQGMWGKANSLLNKIKRAPLLQPRVQQLLDPPPSDAHDRGGLSPHASPRPPLSEPTRLSSQTPDQADRPQKQLTSKDDMVAQQQALPGAQQQSLQQQLQRQQEEQHCQLQLHEEGARRQLHEQQSRCQNEKQEQQHLLPLEDQRLPMQEEQHHPRLQQEQDAHQHEHHDHQPLLQQQLHLQHEEQKQQQAQCQHEGQQQQRLLLLRQQEAEQLRQQKVEQLRLRQQQEQEAHQQLLQKQLHHQHDEHEQQCHIQHQLQVHHDQEIKQQLLQQQQQQLLGQLHQQTYFEEQLQLLLKTQTMQSHNQQLQDRMLQQQHLHLQWQQHLCCQHQQILQQQQHQLQAYWQEEMAQQNQLAQQQHHLPQMEFPASTVHALPLLPGPDHCRPASDAQEVRPMDTSAPPDDDPAHLGGQLNRQLPPPPADVDVEASPDTLSLTDHVEVKQKLHFLTNWTLMKIFSLTDDRPADKLKTGYWEQAQNVLMHSPRTLATVQKYNDVATIDWMDVGAAIVFVVNEFLDKMESFATGRQKQVDVAGHPGPHPAQDDAFLHEGLPWLKPLVHELCNTLYGPPLDQLEQLGQHSPPSAGQIVQSQVVEQRPRVPLARLRHADILQDDDDAPSDHETDEMNLPLTLPKKLKDLVRLQHDDTGPASMPPGVVLLPLRRAKEEGEWLLGLRPPSGPPDTAFPSTGFTVKGWTGTPSTAAILKRLKNWVNDTTIPGVRGAVLPKSLSFPQGIVPVIVLIDPRSRSREPPTFRWFSHHDLMNLSTASFHATSASALLRALLLMQILLEDNVLEEHNQWDDSPFVLPIKH
ncbi:hypothetical protein CBR_g3114 [Chara braunii]|uniref:Uncharacterized protein n=1 Tax=Chara braunii TaxID=69332 RepID=A0A388KEU1_CHABU|nr:hypothetical protein CBR_g3114 [Chara braunii]|eukprot:GBG68569.1 hypothetical protein CBR_g3114 [Chara braunii]